MKIFLLRMMRVGALTGIRPVVTRSEAIPVPGKVIADSYRAQPQTVDDDDQAMANAIAMTEAEPW